MNSNDFQVFYNTLNQKMINETKTYDPSLETGGSLWSSLGGVLSLFLGVSFAMFFEVGFSSWIQKLKLFSFQVFEIFIDLMANTINFIVGRGLGKDYHPM